MLLAHCPVAYSLSLDQSIFHITVRSCVQEDLLSQTPLKACQTCFPSIAAHLVLVPKLSFQPGLDVQRALSARTSSNVDPCPKLLGHFLSTLLNPPNSNSRGMSASPYRRGGRNYILVNFAPDNVWPYNRWDFRNTIGNDLSEVTGLLKVWTENQPKLSTLKLT